jgi:hypothetical protein
MDSAYMLIDGSAIIAAVDYNAQDVGIGPLSGAKLVVFRPGPTLGAGTADIAIQQSETGLGSWTAIVPHGYPASNRFAALGEDEYPFRWTQRYLRASVTNVVAGLGKVQVGITAGKKSST